MKARSLAACLILFALLALAGCAVEDDPAPALIDPSGLVTYAHPTGVFTIDLPPDWVVSDTSDDTIVRAAFSPPGSPVPLIGVTVLDTRVLEADSSDLAALFAEYQAVYGGQSGVTRQEVGREEQTDGSLRVDYLLEAPGEITQHNDFIQVEGPYFAVIHTRLPDDEALLRTLSRIVNTVSINEESGWASAAGGESVAESAVGFASLNYWVDRSGGFVLVGQVRNNASEPLEFVRITAQVYDTENRLLIEQDDFVSSDRIAPGEYAPFSLVFADGLPEGAARYELAASARYASATNQSFYGPANFALTSQAEYDENGVLVVSGQVRNEGSQTANLVKVIVSVFDEDHRIVATDTTLVEVQTLAPGETSAYSVPFYELGGSPATFLVTVQGVVGE